MTATSIASPRALTAGKRRDLASLTFAGLLWLSLAASCVFLFVVLGVIASKGISRFDENLFSKPMSTIFPETAGVQSALFGTLWVIGLTALIALPLGIAAAIHLEEYADPSRWYNRLIELNIQNLAGIPSIVYGILGLGIIARGFGLGFGIRTGALTLSLLVLPVVIIASREAIRSVPSTIRDGSLALGATQLQTIWRQVLPASVPGIATGAILALSRAIGEAAPLLMLGAFTQVLFTPSGWTDSYTVLPIQIYNWVTQSRTEFHDLAAAAIIILLLLLILMNSVAVWLRNRYQKRW